MFNFSPVSHFPLLHILQTRPAPSDNFVKLSVTTMCIRFNDNSTMIQPLIWILITSSSWTLKSRFPRKTARLLSCDLIHQYVAQDLQRSSKPCRCSQIHPHCMSLNDAAIESRCFHRHLLLGEPHVSCYVAPLLVELALDHGNLGFGLEMLLLSLCFSMSTKL